MKIKTLFLKAFGPFTDRTLDFAKGTANLHVIYGPNEAGKSSALRAMTDLRFGIPQQSKDNFVHMHKNMAIAATLIDEHGVEIGVHRRKGRDNTLSMADDAGDSLLDTPVSPDIALALMAGLDRPQFESMYGLDHQRLREGGKSLLHGDGEVGSSLFEASSGATNIKELLAALQADAKKYYASRGHGPILNAARIRLNDQKNAFKEAQTKPKTWKELDSNHKKLKIDLSAANDALAVLRKTDAELTELRTVQPLLKQHDDTAIELDAYINVPLLPERARDRRLSAEQSYAAAQETADAANQTIITCKAALDSLTIEPLLINHESTITNLIADADAVRRNASTQVETQAIYESQVEQLKTSAKCISNTATLESLLEAVPSAADKAVLHGHVEQFKELDRELRTDQKQLLILEQKLASLSIDAGTAPDSSFMKSISQSVREALSVGDIHSRIAALDQEIRSSTKSLDTLLHDIGCASVDELMASRPLLTGEIDATESTLKGIDNNIAELESSFSVINRDLKIQQQRLTTHAAEGEMATLRTLAAIREHRNEGWEKIKQAYVMGNESPNLLIQEYDAETSLPKAFENALGEADRQADILRANADRAAAIAETEKRIAEMSDALPTIEADITNWRNNKTEALNSWGIMLTHAKLPQHSPSILREWLQQRSNCLDVHNRLQEQKQQHAELLKIALAHTTDLAEKLKLAKEPTTEPKSLPALIIQAQDWLEAMTTRVAQQEASRTALNSLHADIQALRPRIENSKKLLDDTQTSLNAWHSRLMLPENSLPSALTARLVELDSLVTENSKIAVLDLQLTKARALSDKVHTDALALAQLLGEPIVTHDMDFADRLKARLDTSKANTHKKSEQERLRTSAQASLNKANESIKTANQSLADLCSAASITDTAYLPEAEAKSSERVRLQLQLSTLTSHLRQASRSSIDDLRLRLALKSSADLDETKERCTNEINELQTALEVKREAEQTARSTLEQIDDSGKAAEAREAMESALADYRAALKPWAQLRLAESLLETALARFKERAQGPMIQKASEYFCLCTGSRYKRLFINDDNDEPILMAERSDGASISVESMSEGTADQLYLALRLSALDMKNDGRRQMPLILDDVLITSDDERSANILKALSQFAVNNQVLVFTHHQHLVELAANTLTADVLATHTL